MNRRHVPALAGILALLLLMPLVSVADQAAVTHSGPMLADYNGDGRITATELDSAILDRLVRLGNSQASPSTAADLANAAYVVSYRNGTPARVVDSAGNVHVVCRPPGRVIVFDGSTYETLRSLNVSHDRVIGVSKYFLEDPVFYPELKGTATVGSVWAPEMEAVVALRPDAVFLYANTSKKDCDAIEAQVHQYLPGTEVYRFECFRPDTYMEEVGKIAGIFNHQADGERFIQFYRSVMGPIADGVSGMPEEKKVPVYFESWNDYKSAANGSGYHEKIVLAGGHNLFGTLPNPYPVIDPEAVLKAGPEVIIKQIGAGETKVGGYTTNDIAPFAEVKQKILARTGWEQLPAVKNDRVYVIHSDILGSSSHFIGVAYLAKWFYPDLFPGLDPLAVHQQYLTEFQRVPVTISRQGAFVYH
jgi:iron complex transport system substrate-binding protein